MDNNISISQEDLDNLTYSQFLSQFTIYPTMKEAQMKGFEAHHIVPMSIQKKNGITQESPEFDDRCIRCTSFEHILIHYLLAKEFKGDYEYIFYKMYKFNNKKVNDLEKIKLNNLLEWASLLEEGKEHSKKILSCKLQGEKNPSFGKKWYNNGENFIYINPNKTKVPKGYYQGYKKVNDSTKNKLKEINLGEKNPSFGKKWYNNGDVELLSKEDLTICGWVLGKLPKSEETIKKLSDSKKGTHWYNNGSIEIQSKECIDGFKKGRLPYNESFSIKQHESKIDKSSSIKGKKCYNNGLKNIYLSNDDIIPEGFVKGSFVVKHTSDETKIKISNKKLDRHFYNNGIKEIMIKEGENIPNGFKKGRLKRSS